MARVPKDTSDPAAYAPGIQSKAKVNARRDFLSSKSVNRSYRNYRLGQVSTFFRILGLIFCIILFIRLFWSVRSNSSSLTFTGFLDWFSNLNSFDISINVSSYEISGDWGIFNGLKNFFNIFAKAFGVIVWLFANLLNLLFYCINFLQFLFS